MPRRPGRKTYLACAALLLLLISAGILALFQARSSFLGPEQHYFDSAGVPIHYIDQGSGPPLLLVHGLSVNANEHWQRKGVVDALAKKYRVIAPDCRGHGRSGKPHNASDYGIAMAEDLVRLLDHLHIPKAYIVGYSMGGFITLNLVANHPDRVLRAAACAAGWEEITPENLAFAESVAQGFEQGDPRQVMARLGLPIKKPSFLKRLGMRMALVWFNDPVALAAVSRGANNLHVTEQQLRHNQVPVVTLIGENDGLLPDARHLHQHMANHTLIILPGKNHMTASGSPDFLTHLLDFLQAELPAPQPQRPLPEAVPKP